MKNFIIFTAGAAVGALATFIFLKRGEGQVVEIDINPPSPEDIEKREEKTRDVKERLEKIRAKYISKNEVKTEEKTLDEVKAEAEVMEEIKEVKKSKVRVEPKVISAYEFEDLVPNYDRGSMTYYVGDKVLVDDDYDDPIDDVENYIGKDALNRFGENEDPDVVYVLNENLGMIYEIYRDNASYGAYTE